ncbi:hypothetical protein PoMZ_10033 [Pyricularia oryzae]|uniref:Uncharacterized protein n=1 Tax=Pyricularia oryzae TaxID=318829 RepID=A0A4P7MW49_PYROR|nr:hypothetical protein PoMZ_10033 [Pyricularia oryzae]
MPKDAFKNKRNRFEPATERWRSTVSGTVASSPWKYCNAIQGSKVTGKMTSTAMTLGSLQEYSSPPHCRANMRQIREASSRTVPRGSNLITFCFQVMSLMLDDFGDGMFGRHQMMHARDGVGGAKQPSEQAPRLERGHAGKHDERAGKDASHAYALHHSADDKGDGSGGETAEGTADQVNRD